MAVTIRNKQLEADIHAIGRRIGKGPTDVLRLLLEDHRAQEALRREALMAKRQAAMPALLALLPKLTEQQKAESRAFMEDMYDENGLPR